MTKYHYDIDNQYGGITVREPGNPAPPKKTPRTPRGSRVARNLKVEGQGKF